QMLLWRADKTAVKPLEQLASTCGRAEARLHALCVLDGLNQLKPEIIVRASADKHAGVRRHAVRPAEKMLAKGQEVGPPLLRPPDDPDPQVQLQLAYTLGEWRDPQAGRALAVLALRHQNDLSLSAAVLSSVHAANLSEVLTSLFAEDGKTE